MKILNFGSLNIDYVYSVEHICSPGETVHSLSLNKYCGGKGLNQSAALARAGAEVYHAGMIGSDGLFLKSALSDCGANTDYIKISGDFSGQAIIQVDANAQNSILLYPGANAEIDENCICEIMNDFSDGDYLLLQNEICCIDKIINAARKKKMRIAFNPSPADNSVLSYSLEYIDMFFVNDIEGKYLFGGESSDEIISNFSKKYPGAEIILTLGKNGAVYSDGKMTISQCSYPVTAVDTTGAGDTFTGYFLAEYMRGEDIQHCLSFASAAAGVCVTANGALPSIPQREAVERFIAGAH